MKLMSCSLFLLLLSDLEHTESKQNYMKSESRTNTFSFLDQHECHLRVILLGF